MSKLKLGISTCLLGVKVRYDGQHKYDHFLAETLARFVEFIPVCPEVECGLPVPREAMRLVGDPENPGIVTIKSGIDHTQRLKQWGSVKLEKLAEEKLCGFIFKSKSPSSGMERIKVYSEKGGISAKTGIGIFSRMFMERFPFLPVEDDGRLHDPALRENFIERIFAYSRWLEMQESDNSPHGLMSFHTRHKLILMAHSPEHYRSAGKLSAGISKKTYRKILPVYLQVFMEGMKRLATPGKNYNVLQHILGYFKKNLTMDEKAEIIEVMNNYKQELIPLIVPVTLLKHFIKKYEQFYLQEQYYLNPHPIELKLRNHA